MEKKDYRIIVVDDDKEITETYETMVELAGYEVSAYTDPYRALQAFLQNPADLVITDLNMPHIDGFQMIRRMRDRQKTTSFIVATGEKYTKTVFQARNLGVAFLFFKPVRLDELEDAINKRFKRALYWMGKLKEVDNR